MSHESERRARRGRAASSNPANRFATRDVVPEADVEGPDRVATTTFEDTSRSVLNRVDSPDLPFHWTLNPYRGCEHGCIYCYARPTHETLGLSCGLDFETRIAVKRDAPRLLRRELARASWTGAPVSLSGVTDPYQPVESRFGITRACLEVMVEARQPVTIVTKSKLVVRDADLLAELARHDAAVVAISLTTLSRDLASDMEPRASTPDERLDAIARLAAAGVPTAVMIAPVIPGLTDHELPGLLQAAAQAGATAAGYVLLRLPHQVKELFFDWLAARSPERATHVERLVRESRDGRLNDAQFTSRMRGSGAHAGQIHELFQVFCRRAGLAVPIPEPSSRAFRHPHPGGERQLELFDDG